MRVKERLDLLLDEGVIQRVIRPLMAGKEAEVFLVMHEGAERVAKLYKTAAHRSFKHRSTYTEGRKVRSTRATRAMKKHSEFGREQEEEAWKAAEVDCIYRLRGAGVRVPEPFVYVEGVLIMELISDAEGQPARRLADINPSKEEALELFHVLLGDVVKMLLAGVVHGDLSDFNILMAEDGPVIIDFPQAVDPAHNNNAKTLLIRDVDNLTQFLGRWAPSLRGTRYGKEMWALYERNELTVDTRLTGKFKGSSRKADTRALLEEIAAATEEENRRRAARGQQPAVMEMDARSREEREAQARREAHQALARIKAEREAEEQAEQRRQAAQATPKKSKRRRPKKRPAPGAQPRRGAAASPGRAPAKAQAKPASKPSSGSGGGEPSPPRRRRRRRPRNPAGGGGKS
jgi:RIO kinase 1